MIKKCSACGLKKEETEFWKNFREKDGLMYSCKACMTKMHNKYYSGKGKDKITEWRHKDRAMFPEKYKLRRRIRHYKEIFNIAYEDVLKMFEDDNRCPICGVEMQLGNKHGNSLCVDHSHTTNKIRGLLCANCNKGLGNFKDNIKTLESAIKYLEDTQL